MFMGSAGKPPEDTEEYNEAGELVASDKATRNALEYVVVNLRLSLYL